MKKALIIFVRNPVAGKTKTRIATRLGDEVAVKVYTALLHKTHFITQPLAVDKFVFYADFINSEDLWDSRHFNKALQHGNDLGERMMNAFELLFAQNYTQVAIIGSDCFYLTAEIINEAFNHLSTGDVVIGPANDGGYYLLGMTEYLPELFSNKEWSTSSVYKKTYEQAKMLGLSVSVLPLLNDVDDVSDITFSY